MDIWLYIWYRLRIFLECSGLSDCIGQTLAHHFGAFTAFCSCLRVAKHGQTQHNDARCMMLKMYEENVVEQSCYFIWSNLDANCASRTGLIPSRDLICNFSCYTAQRHPCRRWTEKVPQYPWHKLEEKNRTWYFLAGNHTLGFFFVDDRWLRPGNTRELTPSNWRSKKRWPCWNLSSCVVPPRVLFFFCTQENTCVQGHAVQPDMFGDWCNVSFGNSSSADVNHNKLIAKLILCKRLCFVSCLNQNPELEL